MVGTGHTLAVQAGTNSMRRVKLRRNCMQVFMWLRTRSRGRELDALAAST